MNKQKEFKAGNVEDAIEEGLRELKIDREEANIEIVTKGGFLKKAVVRIEKKEEEKKEEEKKEEDNKEEEGAEEYKSTGRTFLEEVLKLMNVSCDIEEKIKDEEICFYIKGNDVSKIIGYRGETLDSLQLLTSNIMNKNLEHYNRIVVDADFYRRRREQTLERLAKRLAKKAVNTEQEVEIEPMPAFERRVVHLTLQDSKWVETKSVGEGRDRHVIIVPLQSGEDAQVEYGSTSFKQMGPKRTRSFGYKKKRF